VPESKIRVSLKYCGSCNPLTNLSKIGNELKEVIRKEDTFTFVAPENNNIAAVIILCGCARACGNSKETRAKAPHIIVVAGETIDMVPVAEKDICGTVISRLKS
jgi:hypothetical protein